jgi:hypothetical protein
LSQRTQSHGEEASDDIIRAMSSHRTLVWLVVVLFLAIGFGSAGYYVYETYQQVNASVAADNAAQMQVLTNRARTIQALATAGVSALQATSGFWYTYTDQNGNQSVAYFNLDQWSLQPNLTDADIAQMEQLIASSTVADRTAMYAVPENQLPTNLQFHNTLYNTPNAAPGAFGNTQSQLETVYQNGTATSEQLWELSYMYELQGDYAQRDAVNAVNCRLYQSRCAGTIPIVLSGTVVDMAGRPVQNASVTVLSHPELPAATTDVKGAYSFKLSVLPMEKVRVSAVKRNFTNGEASTIVLSAGRSSYQLDPIVLTSPVLIVTIDTVKHTVTDPNDTANPDGSFVLNATSSSYQIPAGAIVHSNGTPYAGPLDVYIYEFTRDTVPSSLTSLDTFDEVMGYAGNLMQTLGMPYIQFFAPSGEELAVMKSHPMLLTYHIPGMQDMLDNFYNRPQGPLTQGQMQTILAVSAGDPGFPITSQFLYQNKILTFPAFWELDRRKGVWENQGMRLLDIRGTMQAPFYTINDQ